MNKYNIQARCVILSTDIKNQKQYVLSLDSEKIIFPTFVFDKDDCFINKESQIIEFLRHYVYVSQLELIPQIINFDKTEDTDTINITYGFVVNYTDSINSCSWFEFKYDVPNEYSLLLFEVTQNLK
jgi:hypothetical protein